MNITEEEITGMNMFGGHSHYWAVPSTYHNPEDNMLRDLENPIETQYATISQPLYFKTPYAMPPPDLPSIEPSTRRIAGDSEPETYTRSDILIFFLFFLMLIVLVIDIRHGFYAYPDKQWRVPQSVSASSSY